MPKHKTEEEKYCTNTPHQFPKAGRNTSFFVTLPTASSLWSVSLLYFIFLKDQPLFFFVAHSNTSLPLEAQPRRDTNICKLDLPPCSLSPPSHQDLAASCHPLPGGPLSPLCHYQLWLTMTEMWRMCICSSTISEGSWRLGGVARESCSALLMETWKYRVPFSSHCCFQCTSEMSATVPDISAGTKYTTEDQFSLWY